MTVVAVTFDGVRFTEVQDYTNWGNYGGSGAGGAAEAPLAYQNSVAANRKQSGTTLGGIDYDPAAGALDHTLSTRRLFFFKGYVSDAFDLNASEGLRVTVGSSSADTYKYNMAGSTAPNDAYLQYPAQGGYILTAIDVTVAFWTITTTGTFDDTAVDYYGIQGAWIVGTAKAENIAMDAIDVGTGLYLIGGTSTDPDAAFVTYVEKDQDIATNRWGCCAGAGDNVSAWCVLRAGGAIEFFDETSVVSFKDGYHSAGLTGVLHELDTAASTFTMGALLIGEGKLYNSGAIDTRPDYIVTGTTMTATYNLTGTLRNFRNVTLNSKVDANGADIECQLLTQATAEIQNSIIRCDALTSVAVLQDPTFGTTTGLHDTEFIEAGAGHAIEIDSTGTYDFTNLIFTGFGADTTDSAAIDVTTTAAVTINVLGGSVPTYKTAGTGNVTINNAVTVAASGLSEGAAVKFIADETVGTITIGDVLAEVLASAAGVGSFSLNYEGAFDPSGLDVILRAAQNGLPNAAVADDGGSQTDETTAANSSTDDTMTLTPDTTQAVNDAYYLGHSEEFTNGPNSTIRFKLEVTTAHGAGAPTIIWEFWNGSSWGSLTFTDSDPNANFASTGTFIYEFDAEGSWDTTTVNSQGPFYYIRARVSVAGTSTAGANGRFATLDVTKYFRQDLKRTVEDTGLSAVVPWNENALAKFDPLND